VNTTESTILASAFAAVDAWAKANGGKASLAEDPQHAVDLLLAGSPGGLCVSVYWQGDQSAGEDGVPGDTRTQGTIGAALLRPVGLKPRGEDAPATLDLATGLRTAIATATDLRMVLDGPNYAGKTPLTAADGRLLNGYVLRFTVLYAYRFQG